MPQHDGLLGTDLEGLQILSEDQIQLATDGAEFLVCHYHWDILPCLVPHKLNPPYRTKHDGERVNVRLE